jgi:prevent-host-death family protein
MREVSTRDLKSRLSEWVRAVELSGEIVLVTRSGRPVAALVPLSELRTRVPDAAIADLVARGAARAPRPNRGPAAFAGPTVPDRGRPASAMVSDDRR